jgi:porin
VRRRISRIGSSTRSWCEGNTSRIALGVLALFAISAPTVGAQAIAADSGAPSAISTAFSYTGEVGGDVAGGARRGVTYTGAAAAQLTFRLRRIVGWPGLRLFVFVFVLDTHGGAPSDLAGDVQGVSNLRAPAQLRLEEMWVQQNLFEHRLSWRAGRYDLNSEFYRLQSALSS